MFGIGFTEMVVIAVAVIIFVKPDDLPDILRKVGELYGRYQSLYHSIAREMDNNIKLTPQDNLSTEITSETALVEKPSE